MSLVESGDRPIAVGAGGAALECLNVLAAQDAAAAPPYAFEEFQRRGARLHSTRNTVVWSIAASVASLGLVLTVALVTGRGGVAVSSSDAQVAAVATGDAVVAESLADDQPALVDMGQFAITSELEDRIAWIDAALSESRVQSASSENLQQLESTRDQLAESLQHVSYAHSLLSL